MQQKYLTILISILNVNTANAQYMDDYKTVGGDTIINCIDATDGYSIINTIVWAGTNHGLFAFSETSRYVYDSINSLLPDNYITAVDVENDGNYIWIGTNHGICRTDVMGNSWTCFNTSNSSLPSDSITSILAFHQDSVWIGTRQGLVLYRSLNDTFALFNSLNSELPGNHIQNLERFYYIP